MEQLVYLSLLFDFYGALLTDKQKESLLLHLFEDFSLAEVGDALGISRQAVYDNIRRAELSMKDYEKKLGLLSRYQEERTALGEIASRIERLRTVENGDAIDTILKRMAPLMEGQEAGV